MGFTVFYAWQSDLDEDSNRYLIRDAVKQALKNLRAESEIEDAPVLDYGTRGAPGTPDVIETILQKIEGCGIFLADLSFVGQTEPRGTPPTVKRIPNPNVLIELGYAIRAISWQRIVLVMNTAFGKPEELPFDLSRRLWPIQYEWPDPKQRGLPEVRNGLCGLIQAAVRNTIAAGAIPGGEKKPDLGAAQAAAEQVRDNFHQMLRDGRFADLPPAAGSFALSLLPAVGLKSPIDWPKEHDRLSRFLRPLGATGWDEKIGGRFYRTFAPAGAQKPKRTATEIDESGVIRAAVASIAFEGEGGGLWIHPEQLRALCIDGLAKYLQIFRDLKISPPWFVAVGILGLGVCRLGADIYHSDPEAGPFDGGDILPDIILIERDTVDLRNWDGVERLIREPVLDHVARAFGYIRFPAR